VGPISHLKSVDRTTDYRADGRRSLHDEPGSSLDQAVTSPAYAAIGLSVESFVLHSILAKVDEGHFGMRPNGALDRLRDDDAAWAGTSFRAGDVLLVNALTIYGARPNLTANRIRLSADCRYRPLAKLVEPASGVRYEPAHCV
jgi:hypothetical protein